MKETPHKTAILVFTLFLTMSLLGTNAAAAPEHEECKWYDILCHMTSIGFGPLSVASTEMSRVRYESTPHDTLIYDNIRVFGSIDPGKGYDDLVVRPVSSVSRRLMVPGDISKEQCERMGGRVIAPYAYTCDLSTALPKAEYITDEAGNRLDWYYVKDGRPLVRIYTIPREIHLHYATGDVAVPEPFCGDGTCDPTENSANCPDDCGEVPEEPPAEPPAVPPSMPPVPGECTDTVRMCGGPCPPCPVEMGFFDTIIRMILNSISQFLRALGLPS